MTTDPPAVPPADPTVDAGAAATLPAARVASAPRHADAGPAQAGPAQAGAAQTGPVQAAAATADHDAGWRPLPARARRLFVLRLAPLALVPALAASVLLGAFFGQAVPLLAGAAGLLAGLAWAWWYGRKLHRSTAWRLDADGFGLRRGRLFQRETRVPASRVQHLDLRHGPLERRWQLATLVIHTAGSHYSTVTVSGLDAADAERLRDHLAHQLEDADDA